MLLGICLILFGILLFLQKRRKATQFSPLNEEITEDDKSSEIPKDLPFVIESPEEAEQELQTVSQETET